MVIYRAIKTNLLTQGFYDNKNDVYRQWGMTCHGGNDWSAQDKEPVYFDCSCAGFVLNTEIDNNGGLGINIITETPEGIFKHRYWHLKEFKVVAGQRVESGDLIGLADNTGVSTGTHLHRDAKEMVKVDGIYEIKNRDNGTFGTIDYSKWFVNIWIVDQVENLKKTLANLQQQVSVIQKIINWLKGRK